MYNVIEKPSVENWNISCYKRRSTAHIHQSELSLHQVAKYVKRLGIVRSLNVRQGIGFKNSGRDICPSVIKLEQDDHRPWRTKPCRQLLRRTVVKFARQFNTSSETVKLHLHSLGSKRVPHTLLEVHKQQRVAACLSFFSRHHSASIFNRVLTSDEKWNLYNTPKRPKYWLSPPGYCSSQRKTIYAPMHPRKIMLCVWWTCHQVVHYELLPTGQTAIADLFSQQLERIQQALHQKELALVN
ncbi:histone-lysine N-methyltransferase SETMAR [Trichonephila inaurata madagascariensis]|uniref:Histone-lysine N-methyltransferase SETMAR n=1 Tax=Trichonephila inaurata madagascariensis TaxID=2747483 RepID=A0A8X6XCR6_9ARAC|nr:histone-lysine N-methyltransferase SETMAR [Trichonephila inaurata madagascariensis]